MSAFRIYLTSAYKRKARFGKQSGTSINTKPHVSRFAHIGIKAAMVQACKSAMQHNAVIKAYAQRLYAKGKHEGFVMNNVKNILVLPNAFEKTRKQMKANALSINALSDNLNFPMFAKLTLKKT